MLNTYLIIIRIARISFLYDELEFETFMLLSFVALLDFTLVVQNEKLHGCLLLYSKRLQIVCDLIQRKIKQYDEKLTSMYSTSKNYYTTI